MTPRLLTALLTACLFTAPVGAQESSVLAGRVLSANARTPIADAILRIAGTNVSAVSAFDGRFTLRGLPVGANTLQVGHADYGEHEMVLAVSRPDERFTVEIHLARQGMSVEIVDAAPGPQPTPDEFAASIPVIVTEATLVAPATAPANRAGSLLERERILQLAGSSQNVGDLIRRALPTLQQRTFDGAVGDLLCLEFRGTQGRSMSETRAQGTCNHPQVYMDGVPLVDPAAAYRMTSFDGLDWIQAIPPGEAGAQFGAATYGVIVIATTASRGRTGSMSPYGSLLASRRTSFDWSQDPNGHPFLRSFLGAALGNLAGLAAGLEVGRQCVFIEDGTRELDTTCPRAGLAGAGLVAIALPALGSAMGSHFGGRTSLSEGKWLPALAGAAMAIVPGTPSPSPQWVRAWNRPPPPERYSSWWGPPCSPPSRTGSSGTSEHAESLPSRSAGHPRGTAAYHRVRSADGRRLPCFCTPARNA